ncbi:hypothetical protein ACSZNU_20115 [Aeromonas hydrophila]
MSDTKVVQTEQTSSFVDLLGLPNRFSAATKRTQYSASSIAQDKRVMAVACALELIKCAVAAGDSLDHQLNLLGEHADKIQEALKTAV